MVEAVVVVEAVVAVAIGIFAISGEEVGGVEACAEGHWSHP